MVNIVDVSYLTSQIEQMIKRRAKQTTVWVNEWMVIEWRLNGWQMSVCEEDRRAQPSSTNRVQKLYLVENIKFMILFCTRSLLKLHISFIILYIFLHLQPQPTVSRSWTNQVHDFWGRECGLGKLKHGKLVNYLENHWKLVNYLENHGKLVNYLENHG